MDGCTDGRIRDDMCENSDHYRPSLWVGRVDPFIYFAKFLNRNYVIHRFPEILKVFQIMKWYIVNT